MRRGSACRIRIITNAPGLPDPEHYSTARDIAILSRTMIAEFPEYYAWYATPEFTFNGIRQYNRNALLPSSIGME